MQTPSKGRKSKETRWPTFLIIGAGRSGTSSLYSYLGQHPEIYMSPVKEPKFFAVDKEDIEGYKHDERYVVEEQEYLQLFDAVSNERHWGEASPTYLHNEKAPRRIYDVVPDAKLIAVLRNPIDRAYSHYGLNVRLGRREEGTFGTLVRGTTPGDPFWEKYIVPGFYHAQLRQYQEYFDEEQFSIHLFSEFVDETSRVVTELFEFLGVDPAFEPDLRVQRNASGVPRLWILYRLLEGHREPVATLKQFFPDALRRSLAALRDRLLQDRSGMDAETRRRLRDIYHEDVRKLQDLLGRELDHWG